MTYDKNGSQAFGSEVLLLAPLLAWTIAMYFLRPTDPDLWWHLKMGEVILDTGTIPRADIFSFISLGKPMIAHEWLSETIFASMLRSFGYTGLCGLFGVMAALTFCLIYKTCRHLDVGVLPSAITCVVSLRLISIAATVRPQMFTVLCMAVLIHALTRLSRGSPPRWLWGLPIMLFLWANLHGGYIIGVAMLWLTFVVGYFSLERATLRQLGLLSLACTFATLITPHGFHGWLYPFQYADLSSASLRYIAEWQSPNFHDPTAMVMLFVVLGMSVVGVMRAPSTPVDVAWTLALTALALLSSRHVPLFGIVVPPIICARLLAEFPSIRLWLREFNTKGFGIALCLVMPLALAISIKMGTSSTVALQIGREPNDEGLPRGAAAMMANSKHPGNVITEYDWGGYLIYKLYPGWKVGIDGRADVHGDATMDLHYQLLNALPGWQEVANSFKADYIVTRKDGLLSIALSNDPRWELLFEGDVEKAFAARSITR